MVALIGSKRGTRGVTTALFSLSGHSSRVARTWLNSLRDIWPIPDNSLANLTRIFPDIHKPRAGIVALLRGLRHSRYHTFAPEFLRQALQRRSGGAGQPAAKPAAKASAYEARAQCRLGHWLH